MKKHVTQLLFVVIVAVLGISACVQEPATEKIEPAVLELLEDGRNLVILTEKAAQRLDIQTDTVREEQSVQTRTVGGEVMTEVRAPGETLIRVSLSGDELTMIDGSKPAFIMPLDYDDAEDNDESNGLMAELDEGPGFDDDEDNEGAVLYYVINDPEHELVAGQRLQVELAMMGNETTRLVVPDTAVIYDVNGGTWVYISPEPLKFLRYPIVVDYMRDGEAILLEGPPVGTKVVTVGVPELYGTDTGVGK